MPVSGGDHAHIHLHRPGPAHGIEFALLQSAQKLGLHARGEFADLIEKQSAAFSHLDFALLARDRSSERTFFMAEKFAL